jgi:hypothetical protein
MQDDPRGHEQCSVARFRSFEKCAALDAKGTTILHGAQQGTCYERRGFWQDGASRKAMAGSFACCCLPSAYQSIDTTRSTNTRERCPHCAQEHGGPSNMRIAAGTRSMPTTHNTTTTMAES